MEELWLTSNASNVEKRRVNWIGLSPTLTPTAVSTGTNSASTVQYVNYAFVAINYFGISNYAQNERVNEMFNS